MADGPRSSLETGRATAGEARRGPATAPAIAIAIALATGFAFAFAFAFASAPSPATANVLSTGNSAHIGWRGIRSGDTVPAVPALHPTGEHSAGSACR